LKDDKLELAKQIGADDILKISSAGSKSHPARIKEDISRITNGKGIDVVVDCVGAENTIYDSLRILKKGGALVVVGLFGDEIKVPLLQLVINEYKVFGSLWGNYNELCEVIELAANHKLRHKVSRFSLSDINKAVDLLKGGNIKGRAVIVP
jgi:propanol-preferring alcohol dehydrogenase